MDHAQRNGILQSIGSYLATKNTALFIWDASEGEWGSPLRELHDARERAGHGRSEPVAIIGLDAAVLGADTPESNPSLRALNLERDRWRRELGGPVVLWLDPVADRALRLGAPDFADYAEAYFAFAATTPTTADGASGLAPTGTPGPAMPKPLRDVAPEAAVRLRHLLARHQAVLDELGDLNGLSGRAAFRAGDSLLEIARAKLELGERDAVGYASSAAGAFARAGAREREAAAREAEGDIAGRQYRHRDALRALERARDIYRDLGATLGEANCIQSLGHIALRRSDHDTARSRYEEALPLYRRVGDVLGEANCIQSLGHIALRRSDHDTARSRYEEALRLYERIKEPYSIGTTLVKLAGVAGSGELRRDLLKRARLRFEEIGRHELVARLDGTQPSALDIEKAPPSD